MVFIYLKILKNDLSPALNRTKNDLVSNKFNKLIFSNTESSIISEAEAKTPVFTQDLLKSIINHVTVIDGNSLWFGARGGDDPMEHSDPANYAWKKEREYGYFNSIFNVAEEEFLNMSSVSFGKLLKKVGG